MPYNEKLAERIRVFFELHPKAEEKPMMGGLTFMVNGKMCVGIIKDELMVRIDPEVYEASLEKEGCHEMKFTGRPMKGFVLVDETGIKSTKQLEYWLNLAMEYNPKAKASKRTAKKKARK